MKLLITIILILIMLSAASAKPRILITIDDAPNEHTRYIVDALNKRGYLGIFYLTATGGYRGGRVVIKSFTPTINYIIKSHHIIGNHTKSHYLDMLRHGTHNEVYDDMKWMNNYMLTNFNYRLSLFRPPYGLQRIAVFPKWCKKLNLISQLWSMDIRDSSWWKMPFSVNRIDNILKIDIKNRPKKQDHILLMHSIKIVSQNIDSIIDIIEKYGDPVRKDENIRFTGSISYTITKEAK